MPSSQKPVGSSTEPCPLQKCSILVQVLRWDNGVAISGVDVDLRGPTAQKKPSAGAAGTALFESVDPGQYQAAAILSETQAKEFEPPKSAKTAASRGSESVVIIRLVPLAKLKVKVVSIDPGPTRAETVLANASIDVSQPGQTRQQKTKAGDGIADFGTTKAGEYSIRATLTEEDRKKYRLPDSVTAMLSPGEERLVVIQVESVDVCWIEIAIQEETDESPVADAIPYWMELADNSTRTGTIERGFLRLDKIPCGTCVLKLGGVDSSEFVLPAHADVPEFERAQPNWIEVQLRDHDDRPMVDAAYWIKLADGIVKQGKLDKNGIARLEAIPAGMCEVRLPEFDQGDLELMAEVALQTQEG